METQALQRLNSMLWKNKTYSLQAKSVMCFGPFWPVYLLVLALQPQAKQAAISLWLILRLPFRQPLSLSGPLFWWLLTEAEIYLPATPFISPIPRSGKNQLARHPILVDVKLCRQFNRRHSVCHPDQRDGTFEEPSVHSFWFIWQSTKWSRRLPNCFSEECCAIGLCASPFSFQCLSKGKEQSFLPWCFSFSASLFPALNTALPICAHSPSRFWSSTLIQWHWWEQSET